MKDLWFLDECGINQLGAVSAAPDARMYTDDKIEEMRGNADRWSDPDYAMNNLRIDGEVATIGVTGVLLESASVIDDYYARYFGEAYSTYPGIATQIGIAESNPYVSEIQFIFDTPGGMVAGVDNLAQIIATCGKKTTAVVGYMAASAGYYLASQCESIVMTAPTGSVGSIGTLISMVDATEMYKKWGIKFYTISSSNAPRKSPEAHSEEFKKEIQLRVDELAEVFVQRVAEGRSRALGREVTSEEVESEFGRGGLVIAKKALEVGMIDAVEEKALNNKSEEEIMAKETESPEITAEDLSAARVEGVQKERTRIVSLLPFMEADSDRVIAAIKDGEELGAELFGELHAKGIAQAKEQAVKDAEDEEEAKAEAAAEERVEDEAPAVASVEPTGEAEGEESSDADEEAFMAEALKKSKVKTVGGK